jgi:predicted nucleotidyltransferase
MNETSVLKGGLSETDRARFAAVRAQAEKLGISDINFSGEDTDSLDCYEHTLKIIAENKNFLDQKINEEG